MIRLIKTVILSVVLLFYILDKRVASEALHSQRLPWILKWLDVKNPLYIKYGLNGDLTHQAKELIDSDPLDLRLLHNCLHMIYNREQEYSRPQIPVWKIYTMRLKWLSRQ